MLVGSWTAVMVTGKGLALPMVTTTSPAVTRIEQVARGRRRHRGDGHLGDGGRLGLAGRVARQSDHPVRRRVGDRPRHHHAQDDRHAFGQPGEPPPLAFATAPRPDSLVLCDALTQQAFQDHPETGLCGPSRLRQRDVGRNARDSPRRTIDPQIPRSTAWRDSVALAAPNVVSHVASGQRGRLLRTDRCRRLTRRRTAPSSTSARLPPMTFAISSCDKPSSSST